MQNPKFKTLLQAIDALMEDYDPHLCPDADRKLYYLAAELGNILLRKVGPPEKGPSLVTTDAKTATSEYADERIEQILRQLQ